MSGMHRTWPPLSLVSQRGTSTATQASENDLSAAGSKPSTAPAALTHDEMDPPSARPATAAPLLLGGNAGQGKAKDGSGLAGNGQAKDRLLNNLLSKIQKAAVAKSWRAKARATPVVPISTKESQAQTANVDSPRPAPSSSARPPLLPGDASSPQRKPQQNCHHHGYIGNAQGEGSPPRRPSSGTSGGSRSSFGSAGGSSTGSYAAGGYCSATRWNHSGQMPSFFMEYGESTPSYASDLPPCSSCSCNSTPRNYDALGYCPSPPRPAPVRNLGSLCNERRGREVYCLYASPLDHPPINVRSEVETLRNAFDESASRVRLNVGVATAGSLTKLLTLARARKGLVLHLSAHAIMSDKGEVGLVLEDNKGASHVLWRRSLEELLGLREQGLKNVSLLFLSTCWSEELAQVFVECGCRHVVSLRSKVHDAAARRFSQQFYLSLGVGEPLLSAWESARTTLRIEADRELADQAEHFVLFGQHGADEAMLRDLCGDDEESHLDGSPAFKELEDAALFLEMKVPPRPEHFIGRTQTVYEVLHVFAGVNGRRACAVHGPQGTGKSAFGVELAHFAASPGRAFSCTARIVQLDYTDALGVAQALEEELEILANQLEVPLRPGSGDSRNSLGSSAHSARSEVSTASASVQASSDSDSLAFLVPIRQRIRRGFQQIERARRGMRILFVLDDNVGAINNTEIQKLLGELLEHTYQLHIFICSRTPIYRSLGHTKVVNVPLKALNEADAAKLLLHRIHRRLEPYDFLTGVDNPDASGGGDASKGMIESAIHRLKGHPLLRCLAGHPGKIRAASSLVVPGGPSLIELARRLEAGVEILEDNG
mmetsp:Transcript_100/g.190  ORF Transcript_100/g.190 Transcript_100/m.190 type:complete len:828 (-) Transcript_100:248-2731(-)